MHDHEARGDRIMGATSVLERSARHDNSGASRSPADRFDSRANSLDALRLILATIVAVVHASAIHRGVQAEIGATELGELAVDGFFVLSGFLVARSFVRLKSVSRFAWHRALRILPLFWAVLLLTSFVVAPLLAILEGRPALSVFTGPDPAWRYALENMALYIAPDDFGVAGLPTGTAQPGVVNGALWTLFYEAVCYCLVAVLGVLGLLGAERRGAVLVVTLLVAAATLVQEFAAVELPGALFLRFFLVFLFGTLGYPYAERIRVTGWGAVLALAVLTASLLLLTDYRALGAPAFAYLCLWATVATPWLRGHLPWDLSYGMYVFHWPIQTLLVASGVAGVLGAAGYTVLAVLLAGGLAAASWRFLEAPILAHKNAPLPFDHVHRGRR